MKKYLRIELEVDGKVVDYSEYKITSKTTIGSLLKKLEQFLEETAD